MYCFGLLPLCFMMRERVGKIVLHANRNYVESYIFFCLLVKGIFLILKLWMLEEVTS